MSAELDYYLAPTQEWVRGARYRVLRDGGYIAGLVPDPQQPNSFDGCEIQIPAGTVLTCAGMAPVYGATPGVCWLQDGGMPFSVGGIDLCPDATFHPSAPDPATDGLPPVEPHGGYLARIDQGSVDELEAITVHAEDLRSGDVVDGARVAVVMPEGPGRVHVCFWRTGQSFLRAVSYPADRAVAVLRPA